MKRFLTKKFWIVIIILLILILFPSILSVSVMSVYSHSLKKDSIMADKQFSVDIPGGLSTLQSDWFPFVMTFPDNEGFQDFMGDENLSLTILYNFPAFSALKGCSRIYDTDSCYYNSFYGAYLVSDASGDTYGFSADGSIIESEVTAVPEFDFYWLVLEDFGLSQEDFVFDCNVTDIKEDVHYAESDGWTRIDSNLKVSGMAHEYKKNVTSYLQYGRPHFDVTKDFAPVDMKGRIYAKYFPDYDTSIFLYIIAREENVLNDCDENILSGSRITTG